VVALALAPAGAQAASPVLEFVTPGSSLPVHFTTESRAVYAEMKGFEPLMHCAASTGEGTITGPRSTVSEYRFTGCVAQRGGLEKCQSAGAHEEEITTGPIEADLVWISQARHEVGMLLNPSGGTYISFECGGETAEGTGSFLASVFPIDREMTSFAATLGQFASVQSPDEYEGPNGETLTAIPMGKHGTASLVTTGVEATFTVHPASPVVVAASTVEEVEAQAREEQAAAASALQRQHEQAAAAAAAAKQRAEEEAALAAVAKKLAEERAAVTAAQELREREAAAAKHEREVVERLKLEAARILARVRRACEREPKPRRARCLANAQRQYALALDDARSGHRSARRR
jgi:hypothetical protein